MCRQSPNLTLLRIRKRSFLFPAIASALSKLVDLFTNHDSLNQAKSKSYNILFTQALEQGGSIKDSLQANHLSMFGGPFKERGKCWEKTPWSNIHQSMGFSFNPFSKQSPGNGIS